MTNETSGKLSYPDFIKVPVVICSKSANETTGEKAQYIKAVTRLNPQFISAYYPSVYEDLDGIYTITTVVCGGAHYADMSIEEFDKIIESIDRGVELEMVENN